MLFAVFCDTNFAIKGYINATAVSLQQLYYQKVLLKKKERNIPLSFNTVTKKEIRREGFH